MGRRYEIGDDEWDRVQGFLLGRAGQVGMPAKDNRLFLNAVIWIARSGAPWRDLPERFGKWNSVWRRFRRWGQKEVLKKIFQELSVDADLEELMIDSSAVRAHQHAAGALKKNGEVQDEGLGRSRGGLTSKIHALVDALGNPVDFIITGGQVADVTQAEPLLEGWCSDYVLGDKGYDSDRVIEQLAVKGVVAVIPPRSHRKVQREYDQHLYKDRNLIERFFNKVKHFRRIATRYEKTMLSYLSMLYLAASLIWLK